MAKRPGGADYDYGRNDIARQKTFKIKSYDFKSQSDMGLRATGGYGDNAMADPSIVDENAESEPSQVDRLHDKLLRAGITNQQIVAGVTLTPKGIQKVAAEFGISAKEVLTLMKTLPKHLTRKNDLLTELRGARYSYEADFMGNVVVRDSESTDEEPRMFPGYKGQKLLGLLNAHENDLKAQQAVLAQAMAEPLHESEDGFVQDFDFEDEIANDAGSFNFPWKITHHHGTATAAYRGDGQDFEIEIVDVRDEEGESAEPSDEMIADLKKQAIAFIPQA